MRIKFISGEKLAVITTEDGCHIGTVLIQYAADICKRYNQHEPPKNDKETCTGM